MGKQSFVACLVLLCVFSHCECQNNSHAISIVLNFEAAQSETPSFDSTGAGLQGLFEYAEEFYQDVFEDAHILTINYWYDDIASNAIGAHGLVSQSGGRETEANIRIDTKEGVGGALRDWFIDPTPDEDSEFNMQQRFWKDISSVERNDWYSDFGAIIPDTFEVGYTGSAINGGAADDKLDMLGTILHEVGHALGMSGSNTSTISETGDGDYDYDSTWIFGQSLAAETANTSGDDNADIAHLENSHAMMTPAAVANRRERPSHTDLFAMAAAHNYTSLDVPRREMYGGTDWHIQANWTGGDLPALNDDAYIRHSGAVSLSGQAFARDIHVDEGSSLQVSSSTLNATNDVTVGATSGGGGTINIESGAKVVASTVRIGSGSGANGTVNLTGVFSQMIADSMDVGYSGNGTLNVSFFGEAKVMGDLRLGVNAIGNGLIDNNRALVTIDGVLTVGSSGTGEVILPDGVINVGDQMILGHLTSSSQGTVTVIGGTLRTGNEAGASDPDLEIGYHGTGTFTQTRGTTTVADDLVLGHEATGNGTLDLQGGTIFVNDTNNEGLYVGLRGDGALNVSGTGQLVVAAAMYVGNDAGSDGTVNSSGGTIDADTLNIGQHGTGTFDQSGGTVTVAANIVMGRVSGGKGTLSMTGGTLSAGGFFTLGNHNSPGTNAATVSGIGTLIDVAGVMNVGSHGIGTLDINNGGQVDVGGLDLGTNPTGNGTLGISDGTLNSDSDLDVGFTGVGAINQTGGTINVANQMALGDLFVASHGTVTMSGGVLNVGTDVGAADPDLEIGFSGTGFFTQTAGTTNVADELIIAHEPNSNGTFNLQGGTVNITNDAFIGFRNTGELNVSGGSQIDIGGQMFVGDELGSDGTVNMSGGTINAAAMDVAQNGVALFDHTGGQTTIGGELRIGVFGSGDGIFNLSDGMLSVGTISFGAGASAFNFTGGELNVGTYQGNLTQDGGTLAPGSSPGTTSVTGAYSLNTGTLETEFGGAGNPIDLVDVTGNINIALVGTSLDLIPLGGMAAGTYTLMQTTGGTLTGMFENVTDLGVYDDLFGIQYTPTTVTLTLDFDLLGGDFDLDGNVDGADFLEWQQGLGTIYDADDLADWEANFGAVTPLAANSATVPEPACILLAVLGLVGPASRRSRRSVSHLP